MITSPCNHILGIAQYKSAEFSFMEKAPVSEAGYRLWRRMPATKSDMCFEWKEIFQVCSRCNCDISNKIMLIDLST